MDTDKESKEDESEHSIEDCDQEIDEDYNESEDQEIEEEDEEEEYDKEYVMQLKEQLKSIVSYFSSFREEIKAEKESLSETIRSLNEELDEARNELKGSEEKFRDVLSEIQQRHKSSIAQFQDALKEAIKENEKLHLLWEAEAEAHMKARALINDQQNSTYTGNHEIRLNMRITSGEITEVELIPDSDTERLEWKKNYELLQSCVVKLNHENAENEINFRKKLQESQNNASDYLKKIEELEGKFKQSAQDELNKSTNNAITIANDRERTLKKSSSNTGEKKQMKERSTEQALSLLCTKYFSTSAIFPVTILGDITAEDFKRKNFAKIRLAVDLFFEKVYSVWVSQNNKVNSALEFRQMFLSKESKPILDFFLEASNDPKKAEKISTKLLKNDPMMTISYVGNIYYTLLFAFDFYSYKFEETVNKLFSHSMSQISSLFNELFFRRLANLNFASLKQSISSNVNYSFENSKTSSILNSTKHSKSLNEYSSTEILECIFAIIYRTQRKFKSDLFPEDWILRPDESALKGTARITAFNKLTVSSELAFLSIVFYCFGFISSNFNYLIDKKDLAEILLRLLFKETKESKESLISRKLPSIMFLIENSEKVFEKPDNITFSSRSSNLDGIQLENSQNSSLYTESNIVSKFLENLSFASQPKTKEQTRKKTLNLTSLTALELPKFADFPSFVKNSKNAHTQIINNHYSQCEVFAIEEPNCKQKDYAGQFSTISALCASPNKVIYIGTDQGIYKLNSSTLSATQCLQNSSCGMAFVTKQNEIWSYSPKDELMLIVSFRDHSIQSQLKCNSLQSEFVAFLYYTNVYIAVVFKKVIYVYEVSNRTVRNKEFPDNQIVSAIQVSSSMILVRTKKNLFALKTQTMKVNELPFSSDVNNSVFTRVGSDIWEISRDKVVLRKIPSLKICGSFQLDYGKTDLTNVDAVCASELLANGSVFISYSNQSVAVIDASSHRVLSVISKIVNDSVCKHFALLFDKGKMFVWFAGGTFMSALHVISAYSHSYKKALCGETRECADCRKMIGRNTPLCECSVCGKIVHEFCDKPVHNATMGTEIDFGAILEGRKKKMHRTTATKSFQTYKF